MNEVVVQQTTQGFCRYLQAHAKDKLESRGVAIGEHAYLMHQAMAFQQLLPILTSSSTKISMLYGVIDIAHAGYDGRHKSKEFAKLAAAVFVSQGVNVHLFSEVVPTPFVAGAVTYKVAMTL